MALPGGPWDLQEAITEQRTATRTATTPLTLHLAKIPAASAVPQSSSQRSLQHKAGLGKKLTSASSTATQPASHSLRIVQGEDVIKTIDIATLLAGDHEIRLVPPTRATILYSDPDQPSPLDGSGVFSRISTQADSQGESQARSQNAFLRLGLRCKTQFKTRNRSLSRTPSVPPNSAPPPPQSRSPYTEYDAPSTTPSQHHSPHSPAATFSSIGDISYHAEPYSPCPPAQRPPESARVESPYNTSVASNSSKRAHTELIKEAENHGDVRKRRRSAAMQDEAVPGQARRESSSMDPAASLWSNLINDEMALELQEARESPRRDESYHLLFKDTYPEHQAALMSRLESQAPHALPDSTPAKQSRVADMEAQTEEQFVEPEAAFFAGMELLQDLSILKDQMLKECMDATRRLGEGGFVEEEARLIAYYAIEFKTRFLETCSQKAEFFFKPTSIGAGGAGV
ncbi:hypothetical protein F503_05498 [Ophiostoma piceae UAMH 11346]|uniref:Uncharacterized protein n=1 Tax=Ophiostoma piceae (strain UAMH 11346) TaxID=1262450 RepID=S3CUK0_OPHP1|nr:hypothetical protein F503_05498 [Ophiostoma piceae UAMH 11346]